MDFNKNVERKEIEAFEKECLQKVSDMPQLAYLKSEVVGKNWDFQMAVQHTEPDLKKYCSHLTIDIFDEKGERVYEYDEPNCCLMLCETVCYIRNRHIVGIDLPTDSEFLESLNLLIQQVNILK